MRSPRYSPNQTCPAASSEPRRGAEFGRGSLVVSNFSGVCVDLSDFGKAKRREVRIVLRVGNHIVDVGAWFGIWLEVFELAGRQIHTAHRERSRFLHPDFSVHLGMQRVDLIDLRVILVLVGGHALGLEFFRFSVKFCEAALVHHANPEISVLVRVARPAHLLAIAASE